MKNNEMWDIPEKSQNIIEHGFFKLFGEFQ